MQKRPSAINVVWLAMILGATLVAAYTGRMKETTTASFDGAKDAVMLAIGLIGVMALWLGLVKVAEAAGLMRLVARALRPVMVRLFPDVPAEHPAMSAMILNLAANALGLGNAATPLGIKAMQELDRLNRQKGTATNAMCLFLAINTSHIALLPTGVMAIRASAGSASPGAIIVPSILAATCAMAAAILAAKWLARRSLATGPAIETEPAPDETPTDASAPEAAGALSPPGRLGRALVVLFLVALAGAIPYRLYLAHRAGQPLFDHTAATAALHWLIPVLMCAFLLFGYLRGVKVYETLTEGAKAGFEVALRIIPFLVAIFVGIAMLRASGTMELLVSLVNPVTSLVGMPADALPMVFLRPLSGSGAFAFMAEMTQRDPNGFVSYLLAVMQGSTETTFYVLAVYFGAIGIRRIRHALAACLLADATGFVAALVFSRLFF